MARNNFSDRFGLAGDFAKMQVNELNIGTRNRLWNFIGLFLVRNADANIGLANTISHLRALYDEYLKEDNTDINQITWRRYHHKLKETFLEGPWHQSYDIVEFIAEYQLRAPQPNKANWKDQFIAECNEILKSELAEYIFIGDQLCPITSELEKSEIDEALKNGDIEIRRHLETAIQHLGKRPTPDFRNSIKESISSVETFVRKKTGESTLGKAISKLESRGLNISPVLKDGLIKIYAWTNAEGGIRHAMLDETNIQQEDARFMLITCSAFINYFRAKSSDI